MTESRPRLALCLRRLACLLLVGLLGWLPVARADSISCSTTDPTFYLPNFGAVAVPSSAPAGTRIGFPRQVKISFTCDIKGNQTFSILASNFGAIVPPYSGNAVLFQTSVDGIALELTAAPMPTINNNRIVFADTLSLSDPTSTVVVTGQLIKTKAGPITAGSLTTPQPLIGTFEYQRNDTDHDPVDLNRQLVLQGGTKLIASCTIDTDAILVALPVVTTGAFNGEGSTSGSTPFQIDLTCSSGLQVAITLDTASPVAGTTDVIAPSGDAGGVGVQLLDSSGDPVEFDVAKTIGATPDGALSVQYFARYYQTGSAVSAGSLSATATFTISYQ